MNLNIEFSGLLNLYLLSMPKFLLSIRTPSLNSVLASACSGKQLYVFELGNDIKRTVSEAIPRSFDHHSAAVLALDFHPVDKYVCLLFQACCH